MKKALSILLIVSMCICIIASLCACEEKDEPHPLLTQHCSDCGASKPTYVKDYGTNSARYYCQFCYSENHYGENVSAIGYPPYD